jgi:hypothetical protein
MVVENKTAPVPKESAAETAREAGEYPEISLANMQLLHEQTAVRHSDKALLCRTVRGPAQPAEPPPAADPAHSAPATGPDKGV